jgi:hypothetical protein
MDFLKTVLPWVGAAATGGVPALIGMAAKKVGEVIGSTVGETSEEIAAAVAGATPEQMLALKKADQDFQVQMQSMGFKQITDLEKIAADDRANARSREMALRDATPSILAFGVSVGFFGVLGWMLAYGAPERGGDALLVMLGSLGTAWASICAYYFGSSAGSARKTEIMGGK